MRTRDPLRAPTRAACTLVEVGSPLTRGSNVLSAGRVAVNRTFVLSLFMASCLNASENPRYEAILPRPSSSILQEADSPFCVGARVLGESSYVFRLCENYDGVITFKATLTAPG